jgi:hypothetical protein
MDTLPSNDRFTIEAILVRSHPGQVRLVLDKIVLDLDERDVVDVTLLPPPPHLVARAAQPVRIELRAPARLLHVGNADPYDEVIWAHGQLFALRTRRNEHPTLVDGDFLESERRFLAEYGVGKSRSKDER